MSKISEAIADWNDLEPKKKALFIVIVIVAIAIPVGNHFIQTDAEKIKQQNDEAARLKETPTNPFKEVKEKGTISYSPTMLPTTQRNQGLEDMTLQLNQALAQIQELKDGMKALEVSQKNPRNSDSANLHIQNNVKSPGESNSTSVNLNDPLSGAAVPPRVNFDVPPPPINATESNGSGLPAPELPPRPEIRVWESSEKKMDVKAGKSTDAEVTIPANSGLTGILLSGFNARQPAASLGAASSSVSAINVGAPFVSKLKGDAILPNGWKVSDIGECFVGGSAVAVLSTERANAIADKISCVAANGEIWESEMKAYALDADGTLGLAGKVVSKQGSLLLQATLAAMVGGIGDAFAPQPVQTYKIDTGGNNTQEYELPNGKMIAATSIGRGINAAGEQIAKFYLDYAREIFPVVEVTSKTRITWVLKESLTLQKANTKG